MKKVFYQLEIETDANRESVSLSQEIPLQDESSVVCIHKDQIDQVIEALKSAKEEMSAMVNKEIISAEK